MLPAAELCLPYPSAGSLVSLHQIQPEYSWGHLLFVQQLAFDLLLLPTFTHGGVGLKG